jgi:hypothetical protein
VTDDVPSERAVDEPSPRRLAQERPEDPCDPALQPETLGIDDTDTALATEDASDPAE